MRSASRRGFGVSSGSQLKFGLAILGVGLLAATWVLGIARAPGGYGMIAAIVFVPVSMIPLVTGLSMLVLVEQRRFPGRTAARGVAAEAQNETAAADAEGAAPDGQDDFRGRTRS